MKVLLVCVALAVTIMVTSPAVQGRRQRRIVDVDDYLRKFHYLGAGNPDPEVREMARTNMTMARTIGLRMFQMKWDLPMTGVADRRTMAMMSQPRCGIADIEVMDDMPNMDTVMGKVRERIRNRRYTLQGSKWPRDQLKYRISAYTGDLPQNQVDREIRRAFQFWSDVTPLDFYQVTNPREPVDLDIRFTPIVHGDGFDFDGVGGTLAHAFYPQYGGATHFDDSETWTIGTYEGINLLQVAAHEFGHALGLRHSEERSALMYPFYQGYVPDYTLPYDDTAGIQAIYGGRPDGPRPTDRPTAPSTTRRPAPTADPGMPDMCEDGHFDAITTQIINGNQITHVFSGRYYMQIDRHGIVAGFPRLISSDWPGIYSVDAAITMEYEIFRGSWSYRMVTYLFSGDRYYKYVNMDLINSGSIADDWGLPSNLDAIFQFSGDGRIYAIKDSQYYTINSITRKRPSGPPRPLRDFGVYRVNAAFMATNGRNMRDTIFFEGNRYYKIDDRTRRVARGYPKATPEGWLGCNGNADNILYLNSQG